MTALKLEQIGNAVGVILPDELLAHLKLAKGDTVYVTEAGDGAVRLTPYDPDLETQMSAAREIMEERREVLRELAQ